MKKIFLSIALAVMCVSQINGVEWTNFSYEYAKEIPAKIMQPSVMAQVGKFILQPVKAHPVFAGAAGLLAFWYLFCKKISPMLDRHYEWHHQEHINKHVKVKNCLFCRK